MMCGICGYVGDHRPEILEPMCRAMAHRGPDDCGTWHDADAGVGFGHRRLSIIDLSPAGHQPMSNADGTIWIAYNGEVYNFLEHRERLMAKGVRFRGRSDTEVLVYLYEEMGTGFLNELNGIFALAIWDGRYDRLLLARDHAGIKPLYYWQDGRRLFFASEIKALMRVPGLPRELNRDVIPEYLTFLWVPGEATMLRAVQKVEPGHCLTWHDGRVDKRQWFTLAYEPDDAVSEDEWVEQVHDTFVRTTRRQMVSDVPLGAFLSGGTDSSAIAACMRSSFPDREIKCYTYCFDEGDMARDQFEYDYPYARRVADLLGIRLVNFTIHPDVISILPKMVYHNDEPDADPTVFPSYLICKMAREDGTTVLLSGMGGDEVFFGYRSHQALRRLEKLAWVPRWLLSPALGAAEAAGSRVMGAQSALPRRLRKFRRALLGNGIDRFLVLSDWSSPAVRRRIYTDGFASSVAVTDAAPASLEKYYRNFVGRGALNLRSHMLIQTFLAAHNFMYTDKSSMATSVEVRVPFLDVELLRLCARIPERYKLKGQTTKWLLKRSMERYLPRDILHRSKTGFGPPLRKWIADDLGEVIADLLSPGRLEARGLFDAGVVGQIVEENRANRADHAYLIFALLTLELWMQTFLDRPGEEVRL
jgi:asparagine synthase (glutamine-hydrolysing)